MDKYFIVNKPYGVLSQFTKEHPSHRTLAGLHHFPKDVYPVGRLDKDSEGLLVLTNDKKLNHFLLNPAYEHQRTYVVQVEGEPTKEALQQLQKGVRVRIDKKDYTTLPARVRLLPKAPDVPEREPPVRFRKAVPDSWLEIELKEGKNRQVRRMCAKVGFPVLRLIRTRIESLELKGMKAGEVREMEKDKIYILLRMRV